MVGAAVDGLDVNVSPGAAREAVEEIGNEFGLQVAHEPRADLGIHDNRAAATKVHGDDAQRLVHGHHEISGTQNAAFGAECRGEGLSKRDADVFYRVMLVDIKVARRLQLQIECAVASNQLHHVVEEAYAGADLRAAVPLDRQRHTNVRFVGLAVELRPPHACTSVLGFNSASTSHNAASNLSICSTPPIVMRTQPSHPGSAERSRTKIPRCRIAEPNSGWRSPIFISTKFASLGHHGMPCCER